MVSVDSSSAASPIPPPRGQSVPEIVASGSSATGGNLKRNPGVPALRPASDGIRAVDHAPNDGRIDAALVAMNCISTTNQRTRRPANIRNMMHPSFPWPNPRFSIARSCPCHDRMSHFHATRLPFWFFFGTSVIDRPRRQQAPMSVCDA